MVYIAKELNPILRLITNNSCTGADCYFQEILVEKQGQFLYLPLGYCTIFLQIQRFRYFRLKSLPSSLFLSGTKGFIFACFEICLNMGKHGYCCWKNGNWTRNSYCIYSWQRILINAFRAPSLPKGFTKTTGTGRGSS